MDKTLTPKLAVLLNQLVAERKQQDAKWGREFPDRTDADWLTILAEEVGESARAILTGDQENLVVEIMQCAAVCISWLEFRQSC